MADYYPSYPEYSEETIGQPSAEDYVRALVKTTAAPQEYSDYSINDEIDSEENDISAGKWYYGWIQKHNAHLVAATLQ